MLRKLRYYWKLCFKTDAVHWLIGTTCALYTKLVLLTGRMESHLHEDSKRYFNSDEPVIFACWHSRIMLVQSHRPQHRPMTALVSNHSDGRLIGRVMQAYGINITYGSTSKGGAEALRKLIAAYKQGYNLAITPDGPRGPARVASDGVAQLAMLTKAPIICVGYSASRYRRLSSWDKLMIALPFARLYYVSSKPIVIEALPLAGDKHQQREALRQIIQAELDRVTDEADRLAGVVS